MSTITVSNINDGTNTVETVYVTRGSAKAWVNFNGTGTVAIRESLNVSSITDSGSGSYTVNLTTAMPDVNGALSGAGGLYSSGVLYAVQGPNMYMNTTSTVPVACGSDTTVRNDWRHVYVAIFR